MLGGHSGVCMNMFVGETLVKCWGMGKYGASFFPPHTTRLKSSNGRDVTKRAIDVLVSGRNYDRLTLIIAQLLGLSLSRTFGEIDNWNSNRKNSSIL